MQENTLTTNQPKGSSESVSSQVMAPAAAASTNQPMAHSTRPCTSWPRPGMNRLQMAAMTFPVEPWPALMRAFPVLVADKHSMGTARGVFKRQGSWPLRRAPALC